MDNSSGNRPEILVVRHSRPGFGFNFETEEGSPRGMAPRFTTLLFSELSELPDPRRYDGVLVFGGAMFVHETEAHPWLLSEMRFIEAALKEEVPLAGICLGGQLLAHVLGARVYRLERPEFGYHTITLNPEGGRSPIFAGFEKTFTAFEWHYEGFDIPEGGVRLAESAYWPNQAFSYGDRTFGLQLHLEFTREHLLHMFGSEKSSIPQGFVSTKSIRETGEDSASALSIQASMLRFLENFAALAQRCCARRT